MNSKIYFITIGLIFMTYLIQNNQAYVIIGYVFPTNQIDQVDLSKLTHINLAFLNPNSNGVLNDGDYIYCMNDAQGADVRYAVQKAHAAGVLVSASLGGGSQPSCAGSYNTLLNSQNRPNFVNNIVQFVNYYNLDGIDIDLEGDLLTNLDNQGYFTPFIQALYGALSPLGKLVTCATGSYAGGMIPISSIPYFNYVNLMSYDNVGPDWGQSGAEVAPYSQAVNDLNTWQSRGLPKSKTVLGVPFYGYGFSQYKGEYSYAQIISQYGSQNAYNDVVGNRCSGCSYITYNGVNSIKQKTILANQEAAGIMIWTINSDTHDQYSLLTTIYNNKQSGGSSNIVLQNTDMKGNDLSTTSRSQWQDCFTDCYATGGCLFFSWNLYNGGTCWLKNSNDKSQLISNSGVTSAAICQIQSNKDIEGNDLSSANSSDPNGCCKICAVTSGCQAYSWNNYNGGTCWLKSATGPLIDKSGVYAFNG